MLEANATLVDWQMRQAARAGHEVIVKLADLQSCFRGFYVLFSKSQPDCIEISRWRSA